MFFWFELQNQAGFSLLVALQNQREDEDGMGHTSRSSRLLRMEVTSSR
jgi:hypothetical protein